MRRFAQTSTTITTPVKVFCQLSRPQGDERRGLATRRHCAACRPLGCTSFAEMAAAASGDITTVRELELHGSAINAHRRRSPHDLCGHVAGTVAP